MQPTPQDDQLMSKHRVLRFKPQLRLERRPQDGQQETKQHRTYAKELVALAPDVILTGATSLKSLRQATRTIPIVFVLVVDPVGAAHVDTLSRPGGNATGFMQFEYSLAGKWLELLKEVTPGVKRAAVLRDADTPAGSASLP